MGWGVLQNAQKLLGGHLGGAVAPTPWTVAISCNSLVLLQRGSCRIPVATFEQIDVNKSKGVTGVGWAVHAGRGWVVRV